MPVVVPASSSVSTNSRDATSFDGRIRAIDDPKYGGVRLKLDYSTDLSSWSNPFQCTVYRRNADGSVVTVRGGDPYLNYAGKGWLYDQEAPLGQTVSYYVQPIDATGALGVRSAMASIVTTAPAGGFEHPDMWLVSLEDPGASVQVRGTSSLGGSYNGRNDKQTVLGSAFPLVTPDARNGLATQISVLTVGAQEFAAMQKLLGQAIIMRKSSLWERPDGYFTVDDASYAAQAAGTGKGLYTWQLTLTEVSRPNPYGQTVMSPTSTFAASTTAAPLFSDMPSSAPFDSVQGGNLLDAYTADAETGATGLNGWDNTNGNTSIARVTTQAYRGTYSRQITAAAAGPVAAITSLSYPVTPGSNHTFTVWLYSTTGQSVDTGMDWMTGSGAIVASDSLSEWGQTVTLTPNVWTRVVLIALPPSGASLVRPWLSLTATGAGVVAFYDAASLENI